MNGVYVGIVAGLGINGITIPVLWKYLKSRHVTKVYVAIGPDKYNEPIKHEKLIVVDWIGEDSHSNLARQRNRMLAMMAQEPPARWYMMGDNDGMPDDHYFDELVYSGYDHPAIVTGKLFNLDGARYWDIAISRPPDQPKLLPYSYWKEEQYKQGLYFNGNQHIVNKAAFDLNVTYRHFAAEDTWYVEDLVKAGAQPEFNPMMTMTLQRLHPSLDASCYAS